MSQIAVAAIEIPLAGKLLSSNERLHWRRRSERTKEWRRSAAVAAWAGRTLGQQVPRFATAHVTVSVRFPTNHRRDVGNYYPTAKAILDGLVDAGVLPDDNDNVITGPDMRRDLPNGSLRVTVTLEGEPR